MRKGDTLEQIGVSYGVWDPKLIHMVKKIAQFWPTDHQPDDDGGLRTD